MTTIYGQSVTIGCNVTADPPTTFIFWRRNTNNIVSTLYEGTVGTKGISIKMPSLVLAYSTTEDSGSYTCFATNSVGTQKSSPVELLVEGGKFFNIKLNFTPTHSNAFKEQIFQQSVEVWVGSTLFKVKHVLIVRMSNLFNKVRFLN